MHLPDTGIHLAISGTILTTGGIGIKPVMDTQTLNGRTLQDGFFVVKVNFITELVYF
jgi:hypothetical protein